MDFLTVVLVSVVGKKKQQFKSAANFFGLFFFSQLREMKKRECFKSPRQAAGEGCLPQHNHIDIGKTPASSAGRSNIRTAIIFMITNFTAGGKTVVKS